MMDEITLRSVNWEHGMLLSPEHFIRQEQYIDSLTAWALRYSSSGSGLVGGGPRLPESERGSVRHDPIVLVDEDEETIGISVTQARGITPGGYIVDVQPDHPVSRRYSKGELAGIADSNVYVVCNSDAKDVVDGQADEFNPQMKTERLPAYRIALQPQAHEVSNSISVARIRRPQYGTGYEKDSAYIPPCTSLVSFSELTGAWRKIVDTVTMLADRYSELYRAMLEFIVLFEERGIETDADTDAVAFVERMVIALQNTIYEILDPEQSPSRFFRYLRRFFHSAAVYMDLTPGVQQYYDLLKETGETEFIAPMERQKRFLHTSRSLQVSENLAVEVRSAMQSLQALVQLERALEGKYIDFRASTVLESMNFIFDRGGKVLYRLAAKPARVQGMGDELTLYFSNLRLEGREKYRLILVGEQNTRFEKGYRINAEIRLNEGSGFRRDPINVAADCKLQDQHNFEFDFEALDVPTINEARVIVESHHAIRTALLYTRHRFYGARVQEPTPTRPLATAASSQPLQENAGISREAFFPQASGDRIYGDGRNQGRNDAGYGHVPVDEPGYPRSPLPEKSQQIARRLNSASDSTAEQQRPPWEQDRADRSREPGPGNPPPPRRRRLE